jgi:hypothetical protein
MDKILLLAQIASTLMMTGIIWIIQIVQYPFFNLVGTEKYREFHIAHMNWITPVVAPTMIVELVSAVFLLFYPPANVDSKWLWVSLMMIGIIWASTFFLQVPLHEKLAQGFDADAHSLLVNTNWIRTIAWSLRGFLVLYFVWLNLK